MKIKWLIILSALCMGIMLVILMLTKQNIETNSLPEKKVAAIEQTTGYPQLPSVPLNLVTKSAGQTPIKSAITIISKPAIEPKKQAALPSITPYENSSLNSGPGNSSQQGITKIGKQPTHKESQEMQSRGIVMY